MGLIGSIAGENVEKQFNQATPDVGEVTPGDVVSTATNPANVVSDVASEAGKRLSNNETVQDTAVNQFKETIGNTVVPGNLVGQEVVEEGVSSITENVTNNNNDGTGGEPSQPDINQQKLADLVNPLPNLPTGNDNNGNGGTGGNNLLPNPFKGIQNLIQDTTKLVAVLGAIVLGYIFLNR